MENKAVIINKLESIGRCINRIREEYDLKGLEKCDKTKTFANVTIDYKTGKAKKTQVELKC